MASWLERGRPALLEALNAVCDRIDADLRAELQEKEQAHGDTRILEDLTGLREKAARSDRLEEENRHLKAKLNRLEHHPKLVDSPQDSPQLQDGRDGNTSGARTPNPEEIQGKYSLQELLSSATDPKAKLLHNNQILVKKFRALDGNYKKIARNWKKIKQELKARDATITSLQDEVAFLKARLEAFNPSTATAEPAGVSIFRPLRRSRASSHEPPSSAEHDPAAVLSFTSEPGVDLAEDQAQFALPPLPPPTRPRQALPLNDFFNRSTSPGSEDETVAIADLPPLRRPIVSEPQVIIKPEPSSDPVVVVSERQVRKRKTPHDPEASPERVRVIKVEMAEERDSMRLQATGPLRPLHGDSMDLDEMGPRLSTPRKLKLWRDRLERGLPSTAGCVDDSEGTTPRARTPATVETRRAVESSALTPIDANIRISKPKLSKVSRRPDSPRESGVEEGIRSLAEDGNLYQRAVRRKTNNALLETPASDGRLSRLLNAGTAAQDPAIIRSAPRPRTNSLLDADDMLPRRRELPWDQARDRTSEQTPSRHSKQACQESTAQQEAEKRLQKTTPDGSEHQARSDLEDDIPLRAKDPAVLQLSDFKVNPKANDGAEFAFSEVVRGRDNRASLSGCTDMNCCGPFFRQLATIESRKRRPADDMALFEDYLGDSISRIWGLSKHEKDELWLEAKTWQLANTQGKHRHRHARRQSPPGFWNPEFPNTQEIEQEKAEAARREKQMVQERYREAMRPGGRWLFQDE